MKRTWMLLVALGCGSRVDSSAGEVSRAACFTPESLRTQPLVFSSIRKDYESDDYFGAEVSFRLDQNGHVVANVRDARGQVSEPRPVTDLKYSIGDDSLSFSYDNGKGTTYHRTLRPGCDRLTGTARTAGGTSSASAPGRPDTLERVNGAQIYNP